MSTAAATVDAAPPPPAAEEEDLHDQEAEMEARFAQIVPSRLRADIIVQRQFFNGREYYVLKDPLALNYFRLKPEEAYLTTLLDGKRTLGVILEIYLAKYPNLEASLADVTSFVNQLGTAGLLNIGARRFLQHVQAEAARRAKHSRSLLAVWAKIISGMLFIKVPLVDPSPWLGPLAHRLRFLWSTWFVGSALALFAWTAGLLIYNRAAFSTPMDSFFSATNLMLIWVSIIIIKTCHEFGHALTCRHFGGEVHEMGACLMCFTPCGYVDASDSWMMRFKRHKIYTAAAGVFTEFILACVAAHLWLFLPDGLARSLAFNAMLVASVNTLFFNANPLMRFDGYYIIGDLLEVPNLRTKAITYCSARVRGWLLGYRDLDQEIFIEREKGPAFVTYAICAYFYMFMIIYGLSMIFARVLEPYGLKQFGLAIGVFVEGSYALLPVVKAVAIALEPGDHLVRTDRPLHRLGKWVAGLLVVGALIAVCPSHYHVHQQGVVFCEDSETVAATVPGQVVQVLVRTGDWVEPGQPLLILANPERTADLRKDQVDYEIAKLRLGNAASQRKWSSEEQLPQAGLMLNSAGVDLDRSSLNVERLTLRSTVAGRVITPDIEKSLGQYLKQGQPALRVGNPRRFKAIVPLTEDQARLVEVGARLEGRFLANGERFQSTIGKIPRQRARDNELHETMFAVFGGPVPQPGGAPRGRVSELAEQQQTLYSVYLAEATIEKPSPAVCEGMRVRVDVEGQPTTIGKRIWRSFLTLWRLKVPV